MTPFAKRVYSVVAAIPLGQTRTYKWVAKKAGSPAASRAIGQILKRNPYPVIIPCHRVIKSDASLGGYAFGIRNKKELLDIEREIKQCLENKK
jgi:methylated-DNA-[protein]-cysteine S-methyltransferase